MHSTSALLLLGFVKLAVKLENSRQLYNFASVVISCLKPVVILTLVHRAICLTRQICGSFSYVREHQS